MPISLTSLLLHVGADTKDAESGLGRIGGLVGGMGKTFGATAIAMTGGMGLIGAGVLAAAGTLKGFVEAAEDGQVKTAQLEAVLRSTHNAAGLSETALNKMGKQLESLTAYDDEAWTASQTLLLGFTHIGKTVFPQAEIAAANLATRLGVDLSSATKTVGLALDNPIAGMGRLRALGVVLTQQQKDQITAFQNSGQIMKAQGVIIDALNTKYGGAAEAYGKTLPGALAMLSNAFNDIKENIGGAIIPAVSGMVSALVPLVEGISNLGGPLLQHLSDGLSGLVSGGFSVVNKAFKDLSPAVDGLGSAIGGIVQAFQGAFGTALKGVSDEIGRARGGFSGIGDIATGVIGKLTGLWKQLADAIKPGLAWSDILEPVFIGAENLGKALGGGVVALVNQFMTLWQQLQPNLSATVGPLEKLGQAFVGFLPVLPQLFNVLSPIKTIFFDLLPLLGQLLPVLAELVSQVGTALFAALKQVVPALSNLIGSIASALVPIVGILIDTLKILAPIIGNLLVGVLNVLGPLIAKIAGAISENLGPVLSDLATTLKPVIQQIGAWISQLANVLMPLIQAVGDLIGAVLPPIFAVVGLALRGLLAVFQFVWPVIQAIVGGAMGIISAIIKTVTDIIHGNWGAVWGDILNILKSVWDGVWGVITSVLGRIWDFIQAIGPTILNAIKTPFVNAWNFLIDIFNIYKNLVSTGVNTVLNIINNIKDAIFNAIKKPFELARDNILPIFKGLANFAINGINDFAIAGINSFINRIASAIDWVTDKLNIGKPLSQFEKAAIIPKIPTFHTGGTMNQTGLAIVGGPGAEELVMLPAGAQVIPKFSPLFASTLTERMTGGGGPGIGDVFDWLGTQKDSVLKSIANALGDPVTWLAKGAQWLVSTALQQFKVGTLNIPPLGQVSDFLIDKIKSFIDNALKVAANVAGSVLTIGIPGMENFSEFHGFNGDCGETAELIALHAIRGTALTAANLNAIVHRDQQAGWADRNGVISVGGIVKDLMKFEGLRSTIYSGSNWKNVLNSWAGRAPVIFLYSNAGRLPGDEPGVQWHFNTALANLGNGNFAFGDGDNRLAGTGKLNIYSLANLAAAQPQSLIVVGHADGGWVTEPVVGYGLRTGRIHTFAERAPELVMNQQQLAAVGGGPVYHINVATNNEDAIAQAIVREQTWHRKLHG